MRRKHEEIPSANDFRSNYILPVEILGLILGEHFNTTPDIPETHPNRSAPLEVCKYWNNAVLSNPLCWTDLEICLSHEYSVSTILRHIENQFSRAQHLPINLTM